LSPGAVRSPMVTPLATPQSTVQIYLLNPNWYNSCVCKATVLVKNIMMITMMITMMMMMMMIQRRVNIELRDVSRAILS